MFSFLIGFVIGYLIVRVVMFFCEVYHHDAWQRAPWERKKGGE